MSETKLSDSAAGVASTGSSSRPHATATSSSEGNLVSSGYSAHSDLAPISQQQQQQQQMPEAAGSDVAFGRAMGPLGFSHEDFQRQLLLSGNDEIIDFTMFSTSRFVKEEDPALGLGERLGTAAAPANEAAVAVAPSATSEAQAKYYQRQPEKGEIAAAEGLKAGANADLAASVQRKPVVLDLNSEKAFPSLGAANSTRQAQTSTWGPIKTVASSGAKKLHGSAMLAGRSKAEISREVIDLPLGHGGATSTNAATDIAGEVARIMQRTGTKIEMSRATQLQTITFLVTGPKAGIAQAKREIISNLSPKVTATFQVPSSARPYIVGTKGKTLQGIQNRTGTSINIPKLTSAGAEGESSTTDATGSSSNELITDIVIHGEVQGVNAAKDEILSISELKTGKRAVRITQAPIGFYPFIAGFGGKQIKSWKAELGDVAIQIPNRLAVAITPSGGVNYRLPDSAKDSINIVGVPEAVERVVSRIKDLCATLRRDLRTVSLNIPRQQHRFIVGHKGAILGEIMETTGCIVSIPAAGDSDMVTLCGPDGALRQAAELIMSKANETKIESINPAQFHTTERLVLYAQRAIRYLVYRQKHLRTEKEFDIKVSFPNAHDLASAKAAGDIRVTVTGKSESNVKAAAQSLSRFFHDLPPYHFNTARIEPHLHEAVRGPSDSNLSRLRDTRSIDLVFPEPAAAAGRGGGSSSSAAEASPLNEILVVYEGFNPEIERIRNVEEKESAVRELIRSAITDVRKAAASATGYSVKILEVPAQFHRLLLGPKGNGLKDIRNAAKVGDGEAVFVEFGSLVSGAPASGASGQSQSSAPALQQSSTAVSELDLSASKSQKKRTKKKNKAGEAKLAPPKPLAQNEVAVKGRTEVVERVSEVLLKRYNKLKEYADLHSFKSSVRVPTSILQRVVGKNNSTIKKLKGDYELQMEVIENGINNKVSLIELQGTEKDVEKAKAELEKLVQHLEDQVTQTILLDSALHPALIGPKGRFVRRLEEKYAVRIKFPHSNHADTAGSEQQAAYDLEDEQLSGEHGLRPNEIRIHGGRRGVENAKQELLELAEYEKEHTFTETMLVAARHLPHILGRAGARINEIKHETSARIDIPQQRQEGDEDAQVQVKFTGTKEAVREARKQVQAIVKEQSILTEVSLTIPARHHRYLIGPNSSRLRDLVCECGGDMDKALGEDSCRVRFPPMNSTGAESEIVTIRGDRAVVKRLQEKIEAIVAERERIVTVTINIPVDQHRYIIGRGGQNLQKLRHAHAVDINFASSSRAHSASKDSEEASVDPTEVTITGLPENCEAAKAAMLSLVKEQRIVAVPQEMHRRLGGRTSNLWRRLRKDLDVTVEANNAATVDPSGQQQQQQQGTGPTARSVVQWVLRGEKSNLQRALTIVAEAFAKASNAYVDKVRISSRLHRYVIGPRGSTISRIRDATNCEIEVPSSDATHEDREWITVIGDKEDVSRAIEMIEDAVENRA